MKEEDSSSLWKWYIIIIIIIISNVYILLLLLLLFPSLVWKFNLYLSDLQHLAILSSFVNFQFTIYNDSQNSLSSQFKCHCQRLYIQTKRALYPDQESLHIPLKQQTRK